MLSTPEFTNKVSKILDDHEGALVWSTEGFQATIDGYEISEEGASLFVEDKVTDPAYMTRQFYKLDGVNKHLANTIASPGMVDEVIYSSEPNTFLDPIMKTLGVFVVIGTAALLIV